LVSNTAMGVCSAALVAIGLCLAGQHESPTLGRELQKHGIPVGDFADADRQITSFAVQSDADWFGIAYYWYTGLDRLPDELRVRTLDRAAGLWRETTIGADVRQGGSALRLTRRAGFIYLDLHVNPSAGHLLVLTEDLTLRHQLMGWSSLVLPDGRLVYEHSMTHFAPFHAASASLYDPHTGRDTRLVPLAPDPDLIKAPRNRSIRRVASVGDVAVRFTMSEEDLRWVDSLRTEPVGPLREYTITCTLDPAPSCVAVYPLPLPFTLTPYANAAPTMMPLMRR
jgi:hypothetical protein